MKTTYWLLLLSLCGVIAQASDVCPESCKCSRFFHKVICRKASLKEIPQLSPDLPVFLLDLSRNNLTELRNGCLQAKNVAKIFALNLNLNDISTIETDAFRGLSECLVRLILSDNPHLRLPEVGFHLLTLTYLFMNGCNLKEIPANFFKGMPDLTVLDLRDNRIAFFDPQIVNPRTGLRLEWLALHNNELTKLPLELVSNVAVNVGLGGNPFHCDCEFRVAYAVLAKRDWYRLMCVTPPLFHDVSGSELLKMKLHCDANTSELVQPDTWWGLNLRRILICFGVVGAAALVAYMWQIKCLESMWIEGKSWFDTLQNLKDSTKMTTLEENVDDDGNVPLNE